MIHSVFCSSRYWRRSQAAGRLASFVVPIVLIVCSGQLVVGEEKGSERVQFNRDIRPILSDRCFVCHGPDRTGKASEETDLRLDLRESAVDEFGVIEPGKAKESEFLERILTDDPDLKMPPAGSHVAAISAKEIDLLRRWIDQGAPYQKHWAFIPPKRAPAPKVLDRGRVQNPIDSFVLAKLEGKGIESAPLADRRTLIRRVTLDLTGLPPTPEEVATFVNDPAPRATAYEKVVVRLLKSDRYGEHMARFWLDAARYADSGGYQYDLERKQWVWRDWVIEAFNSNMPFDQFTIEQLAGDLLPHATDQTRLATAFNRNHPITIEGGVIDEEYRTEYVIDRVLTSTTIWLGMTFTCARCHDHKYDPISQEDFYSFYAFFNNVPERGFKGFDPKERITSPLALDRLSAFDERIASLEQKIEEIGVANHSWEGRLRRELQPVWIRPGVEEVVSTGGATFERLEDGSILAGGRNPAKDTYEVTLPAQDREIRVIRLEAFTHESLGRGSTGRSSGGNYVLSELEVAVASKDEPNEFKPVKIVSAEADFQQKGYPVAAAIDGKKGRKGWAVEGHLKHENRTARFTLAEPIPAGSLVRLRVIQEFGSSHQIGRFRVTMSPTETVSQRVQEILAKPVEQRTTKEQSKLLLHLVGRFGDDQQRRVAFELGSILNEEAAFRKSFPQTMIMSERKKPRKAYVLDRGEYDKPRKEKPLEPNIPKVFGALDEEAPKNRLGLARWLVSREQPMTARVTVNRFWQQVFGVGLVKTSEDFGAQSEWPSHPELLDWLAVEFMESGWDMKQLFKTMVMSNTYQQSSRVTEEAFAMDPENRLLARGPRFRLEGESLRDSALAVSGLLDQKIGGPSVYPYHPKGLWLEINNRPNYSRAYPHPKAREHLYRRSVYTYWKRTVPPPSMATFDAPGREYCVVRRSRTNTPLQAFVMLHDPQFVEAARHLGARMIREGGNQIDSRISRGFELCQSRPPNEKELMVLRSTYDARLKQYQADPDAAKKVLAVGETAPDASLNLAEHAASTQIARILLNLSEFLTKG